MKTTQSKQVLSPFNKEVKAAYYKILKEAKSLLAALDREELRYSLIREDCIGDSPSRIIHEFVNPLLYLRLESYADSTFGIRYGFEPCEDYQLITSALVRFLYKVTMQNATSENIESCIKTQWYIHNPDEMYAYLEEQMKHHTFQLIKHKPAAVRRKQMRVVA
jgi:hypothetical protein